MRTLTIIAALTLLHAATAAAQIDARYPSDQGAYRGGYPPQAGWGGYAPQARVWVEDDRDFVRRGDRLRAAFSTSADAYVAVIHIDPDGRLEFLYPSSPWDAAYVAGGRSYALPYRSAMDRGWLVRSGPGIGYLYMIASPVPLDYGYFQTRGGTGWDWSYGGERVRGDPFWAFEQITRYLVPDWGYAPVAVDYYSYQVGGIHRYPAYACSSPYSQQGWGWGWGGGYTPSYYGSCDRLDVYLRQNPNYFDAMRYGGDRRSTFRQYRSDPQPIHRFREDPTRGSSTGRTAVPATGRAVVPSGSARGSSGTTARPQVTQPARRPTLERRDPPPAPARGAAPSGGTTVRRATPSGAAERPAAGSGDSGPSSSEPRRRAPDGAS